MGKQSLVSWKQSSCKTGESVLCAWFFFFGSCGDRRVFYQQRFENKRWHGILRRAGIHESSLALRRPRSPRFTSRTTVTIPPFCFVAVLIWRGRQLRGGYRMRTWTGDGGSKSGPVQQATVRGAAKMGRRWPDCQSPPDACLLMIDYRVEACAAVLRVNQQCTERRGRGECLAAQGLHAQRAAWL